MPHFDHGTLDTHGNAAPLHMVGLDYRHTGNGHVYSIKGTCWIGDTDEWGLVHTREDSPNVCVRSLQNFQGNRSNGQRRYEAP